MIRVGMKARFCPSFNISGIDSAAERAAKFISGTVFYVNMRNKVFYVRFNAGDSYLVESFKFYQVGQAVKLYG